MATEAPSRNAADLAPQAEPPRSAWWVRVVSMLPLSLLYRIADVAAWLALRVFSYRDHVVHENLSKAFPEADASGLRAIKRDYYQSFADMLMEVVKSASMPREELVRRLRIVNLEQPRELLAQGRSVLLVAAHQCNWEWMLLGLSLELGYPVDAAYKPLVDNWAEREMKKLRSRFGSRLIPAKDLLPDILKRRDVVRAIAMVADQEPTTSERKHWTRFLNRDTAFYMGPEEIARVTRLPVFFIGMRRTARGHYEMRLTPLVGAGETLGAGELTERYVQLVEAQIRAAPPDWPWSHKRWKLKRSVYNQPRPRSVS
jgi:Kdo2-lipid IVA lauroyltransferase/acyltransferase